MNNQTEKRSNGIPACIEYISGKKALTKVDTREHAHNDVTNQDIASMKRMIQDIRQNPDLLYALCDMPDTILQKCPEWSSVENPITLRRSSQRESEQYYCQECDSPIAPKCQMQVDHEITEFFKSGNLKINPIQW